MNHLKAYLLLGIISSLTTTVAWADSATDDQNITVTVPKVLLVNVEDITPTITYTAPTVAGNSFTSKTQVNNKPKVAFTSNVATANLYAKATVTSPAAGSMASYNLSLTVDDESSTMGGTSLTLTDSDQIAATVGNQASGELASTPHQFRITGGLASLSAVPPYGSYTIQITYTLKDS